MSAQTIAKRERMDRLAHFVSEGHNLTESFALAKISRATGTRLWKQICIEMGEQAC